MEKLGDLKKKKTQNTIPIIRALTRRALSESTECWVTYNKYCTVLFI